jgi:hypothetical protein
MMVRDRSTEVLDSVTLEEGARWELRLDGPPGDSAAGPRPDSDLQL